MQVVYVGKYYSHVIPVTFQEGMKAIQGRSQAAKQSPNYCSLTRPVASESCYFVQGPSLHLPHQE